MIHCVNIKNFGKVNEADIRLAPFTAIVGPNSSGKSFITKALYSIFHTVNQDLFIDTLSEKIAEIKNHIKIYMFKSEKESYLMSLLKLLDKHQNKLIELIEISKADFDFITSELLTFAKDEILPILNDYIQKLQNEQKNKSKKESYSSLKKAYYSTTTLSLCSDLKKFLEDYIKDPNGLYSELLEKNFQQEFLENFQTPSLTTLTNHGKSSFDISQFGTLNLSDKEIQFKLAKDGIRQFQKLRNVIYLESPIYFKIRSGLLHAREFTPNNFRRKGFLSGVPKYFYDVDRLLNSDFLQKQEDELNAIATDIEKIIGGSFEMYNGDLLFKEKTRGLIPANMASSGVSNLGNIALLIRKNILSRGSYLFIDEPEVNLHPEWQHLMLDILVALSKKDIHVVIATHSLDVIFKLEDIVSNHDVNSEHFSINRLNIKGESEKRGELLQDIRQAKIDLGKPYAELYESRLP